MATDVMRVRVLFFGLLKDAVGVSSEVIELRAGASIRDVLALYEAKIPRLKESSPSLALAVNQQYASPDTRLEPDDEVALLPPVSGGVDDTNPPVHRKSAHCELVREPIDTGRTLSSLKCADDGAALVFEGMVRNQTRGRKTLYLNYEAYEEMALQEMESLVEQALRQFQIRDVALVHRLGRLEIGETSVLIAVASAHRAAAFEACRWLIDTLKRTVPIWKKEYFEDGAVWADGEPFPPEIPRANSSPQGSPAAGSASK
ncbi:MAG TPA: molybdenum cofactor biosynthesis protein MoaE [Candidatus Sulfotelmatobacter sp.]|nr:molybdenum cofactor biosynthesis protein MoaE [Candidatus Sulfotelmatobacter sp.]